MTKKEDDKLKPVATRKLTPAEQRRVDKMRERKSGDEKLGFLKTVDNGTEKPNVTHVLKSDLSGKDAEDDKEARMMEATGHAEFTTGLALLVNMSMPLFSSVDIEKTLEAVNKFGKTLRQYSPADAIEGSLCAQAEACQQKAMSLLSQAERQKNIEWARMLYNASSKLLARSQEAFKTLINYRRGGQQKMVIEHVSVEAGAQAIVGNVGLKEGQGESKNNRKTT